MDERDGCLSLNAFLAKRWDVEGCWKTRFSSDEELARKMTEVSSCWSRLRPEWSAEQVRTVMSLQNLQEGLKEVAVARRFTLDDPAELGRGLGVHNRLRLTFRDFEPNGSNFRELLDLCAVRDLTVAERLVEGRRAGVTAIPTDVHLADIAVTAILQKELETLRLVTPEMAKRKVRPWMQGIYTCLTGIADEQPNLVASGLQLLLTGLQQMRQKDELEEAINFAAHGMHRLCEWVSPDLVAGFDVAQPFPWDAKLHAWCQNHPHPLDGVELGSVSPVLQETVVMEKPPAWLKPPVHELHEIVLLAGDPKLPKVIEVVGGCAGTSGSPDEAKRLLGRCPVILRWNLELDYAERLRESLAAAGATAEVRGMKRTLFTFV